MSRQASRPVRDRASELLALLEPRPAKRRAAKQQPDSPYVDLLAPKFLPHICPFSTIPAREQARSVARLLIAAYERELAMTAPTRRVNYRKSHHYFLDDEQTDGVTDIVKNGVPKGALVGWASNITAEFAVDNWDELAAVSVSERLKTLKSARQQATTSQGDRGTEIHAILHRLGSGEKVEDIADELIGHVDAGLRFASEWILEDILSEITVGNRRRGYMGTLDLVARLTDGHIWLLDFKTGNGVYPESALQLAAYRHAEFYLDENDDEQPFPEVDKAGLVWLRADGYDLYEVDASERTFMFFLHAKQVARFVKEAENERKGVAPANGRRFLGEALTPPRRLEAAS